jgi:energy-coupling factor transporter ATP-binding protein EcfA2
MSSCARACGLHPALNEAGHTIVLTTHYLEEAEMLCNRIAMLKAGRIVALDTTPTCCAGFPRTPAPACRPARAGGAADGRHRERRLVVVPFDSFDESSPAGPGARSGLRHRRSGNRQAGSGGSLRSRHAGLAGEAGLNMRGGFSTLLYKEVLRFWKVASQTVAAPVLTALLYLLIFSHVLEGHVKIYGVAYTAFLIPGLVMMSVLQNAFANSARRR